MFLRIEELCGDARERIGKVASILKPGERSKILIISGEKLEWSGIQKKKKIQMPRFGGGVGNEPTRVVPTHLKYPFGKIYNLEIL